MPRDAELHPEALLDRARSGSLSREESALLKAHLADCAPCRAQRLFDEQTKPRAGDEALLMRAVSNALVPHAGVANVTPITARPRSRRWPVVVAIATVTIGVAAAASLRDTGRSASQPVGAKVSVVADAKERSSTATASSASAPRAPAPPPATVADVLDAPLPVRSAAPERASAFPSSAQELLTKADQLRRSGSPSSALVTYRELQRRFPSSIEAQISRMSAGRMLLTSSGDAAGALRQFDGYLAHGSGALREEALIGRATALARLGRTADERATWRQLLREYPNSQGARLARTRLDVTGANRP